MTHSIGNGSKELVEAYFRLEMPSKSLVRAATEMLSDMQRYLSTMAHVVKVKPFLVGSLSTGLWSASSSSGIDLVLVVDAGPNSSNFSSEQVSQIVVSVLKDYGGFTSGSLREVRSKVDAVGEDAVPCNSTFDSIFTVRAVANLKLWDTDKDLPSEPVQVNIHPCTLFTVPIHTIFHTRLFGSYARLDAVVPLLVSAVKRWFSDVARSFEARVFSGYHLTLLVLHYLCNVTGVIPNLHATSIEGMVRDIYGTDPETDSYSYVPESDSVVWARQGASMPSVKLSDNVHELLVGFIAWLSTSDLLEQVISLNPALAGREDLANSANQIGWLQILDPTSPVVVNSLYSPQPLDSVPENCLPRVYLAHAAMEQEDVVRFFLQLQVQASLLLARLTTKPEVKVFVDRAV